MGAETVFISYSHDSPEHSNRVLTFSNKLRDLGVDTELDQYQTRPPQGWPQWCEVQLRSENSKFVILICTSAYRNRVDNQVPADEGRGVYWEGSVISQYIYKDKANERFLPVLLDGESDESIPIRLQGFANFRVNAFDLGDVGFEALYRELTGQPAIIKPTLGTRVVLGAKVPSVPVLAAPLPHKPALTIFPPLYQPSIDISRVHERQALGPWHNAITLIRNRGSNPGFKAVLAAASKLLSVLAVICIFSIYYFRPQFACAIMNCYIDVYTIDDLRESRSENGKIKVRRSVQTDWKFNFITNYYNARLRGGTGSGVTKPDVYELDEQRQRKFVSEIEDNSNQNYVSYRYPISVNNYHAVAFLVYDDDLPYVSGYSGDYLTKNLRIDIKTRMASTWFLVKEIVFHPE
jgi:hypothetical protein